LTTTTQGDLGEVERQARKLPARSLGDLLGETFAIYGTNFWRLIGLVAVVQVPVSLLALALPGNTAALVTAAILVMVASVCVFGATIFAVGQHYVSGEIRIGPCYTRVWWHVFSLLSLVVILTASMVLAAVLAVLVVPAIVLLVMLGYWSLAVQAVIIEGCKPVAALRRSYELVKGNWWRVSWITGVILLLLIGLGLLLGAPFALASRLVAPDDATVLSTVFQFLRSVTVATVVPSVAAIASTLLYYDLRVRKENYDFSTLSGEMGKATAFNRPHRLLNVSDSPTPRRASRSVILNVGTHVLSDSS